MREVCSYCGQICGGSCGAAREPAGQAPAHMGPLGPQNTPQAQGQAPAGVIIKARLLVALADLPERMDPAGVWYVERDRVRQIIEGI